MVCWNAGRNRSPWRTEFAEAINRLQPDIVAIIEAGGDLPALRTFFAQHCPDFEVSCLRTGLVCLTRGQAGEGSLFSLAGAGACGQLTVNVRGQDVELLVVDINSTPIMFRAGPLGVLTDHADELRDRPTIVLGDFNTPRDSVHLNALRTHHRHAFETAGQGYDGTWPVPLPVLNLDQIWTNQCVQPQSCQHVWTTLSDHRLVVADVTIVPPAQAAPSE
ncbi:MAG: endonuclease/exonuclease/phosphatase family protein [Planctomycetaceae bacterium]|nr:endonuclease/exonuclease/phosphatase family protein [Planctomycetaceae bacterium]